MLAGAASSLSCLARVPAGAGAVGPKGLVTVTTNTITDYLQPTFSRTQNTVVCGHSHPKASVSEDGPLLEGGRGFFLKMDSILLQSSCEEPVENLLLGVRLHPSTRAGQCECVFYISHV